jgi:hypothetical protein
MPVLPATAMSSTVRPNGRTTMPEAAEQRLVAGQHVDRADAVAQAVLEVGRGRIDRIGDRQPRHVLHVLVEAALATLRVGEHPRRQHDLVAGVDDLRGPRDLDVAALPTFWMRPFWISTTPFSITGPVMVRILPALTAIWSWEVAESANGPP